MAAAIIAIDVLNNSCYFSNSAEISNTEQLELCISAFTEGAMFIFMIRNHMLVLGNMPQGPMYVSSGS